MIKVYSGVYPAVTAATYQTSQYIQKSMENLLDVFRYQNLINSKEFKNLLKKDLKHTTGRKNWEKANKFFEEHAQFIYPYFGTGNPGKASELWLDLLEIITKTDSKKYDLMHKGTAYYHTGVWSLFAEKYTEALQWLEYAYEEDLRLNELGRPPEDYPAGWLLALDLREGKIEKGNDHEKTKELINLLDHIFRGINSEFKESFRIENLAKIARKNILASKKRALRSSWASLLASIWEFKRLQRFLVISPQKTEAQFEVNNFLVNLTLILETFIPYKNRTRKITLIELYKGPIWKKYKFKLKGGKNCDSVDKEKVFLSKEFPWDYSGICKGLEKIEKRERNKLAVAFTLAYRVRNQTHHMFNEEFISLSIFNMIAVRIYYTIFKVLDDFHTEFK